jgi:prepilin-type N-terminal cleavage/methylation domain-containing protein
MCYKYSVAKVLHLPRWDGPAPTGGSVTGLKGFSLIELLVVVSIVTLLSAFLLPGLSRAREYAYFTSCKNSLRQIAIGFLCFAANHRGMMPLGDRRCGGGDYGGWAPAGPKRARRVGTTDGSYADGMSGQNDPTLKDLISKFDGEPWMTTPNTSQQYYNRLCFIKSLYSGPIADGQNWPMTLSHWGDVREWTAVPRLPGTYLPIEIFWDPIIKVRDWTPWGGSSDYLIKYNSIDGVGMTGALTGSGTETARDKLTRRHGILGYDLFLSSVGCIHNKHDAHKGVASYVFEQPARYATKSREVTTSHNPSVWVASCIPPLLIDSGVERFHRSHFSLRNTVFAEFRFNVVHLDGHVDDSAWMEHRPTGSGSRWLFSQAGWWEAAYGWRFKAMSSPEYIDNADDNLEPIPGFPRPFDRNS